MIANWMILTTFAVLVAALAGVLLRASRLRRELTTVQQEVEVFAEASIRVADTLNALMQGDVTAPRASQSSRRYLVQEASDRARAGEPLQALKANLGLSHDEVSLLERIKRAA